MSGKEIKISVIIVNYNVKDFLEQALLSVKRALSAYPSEIIVVDNASIDGSVPMLKKRFPDVRVIENHKNVGFSAANNQAIKIAQGEFIVLLNPDTVVQEDTFERLFDFFEQKPDVTAATCKILNPDGTFSVDCRHSIPTPLVAFWKVTGLSNLFPKSKIFGKYNLTYLDENETYPVEAISGSFMMIKREIVKKIGLLDERFFMYCEDIDYCYRINQAGGKIYYVPTSQIIHYKGESTKKDNLDYVITFNRSLYQFYQKHFQQKYIYPFKWLILLGVILRGFIIYTRNILNAYFPFLIDVFILNSVLYSGFFLRQGGKVPDLISFTKAYLPVNLIATIIFFFSALFLDTLIKDRISFAKIIKANFITFTLMAAFTFFLKQFAYSRLVVLVSMLFSIVFMVGWRALMRYYSRKATHTQGKQYFLKRTLIVGLDEEARYLLKKLREWPDSGLNILGLVSLNRKDIGQKIEMTPVVTALEMLTEYLRMNKVDLIIFTTNNVSYERILSTMAAVQNPRIEFKMVPGHLELMVSKSTVERFDSIPLLNIEYAYGKP
ncbi:MAG TPA: glycosyltransferase, partial [Calditrichaeota bacterium]|nr:glycosyltransferase [Calditrichota bacterium]